MLVQHSADVCREKVMFTRPHWSVLNENIPVYLIGKNRLGHWVVRKSDGSSGGEFLVQAEAVRFANRESAPGGCALVYVTDFLELDSVIVPIEMAQSAARSKEH